MTLDEYIQKLEAAQKVLPDMISVAAKNATIRAVEAAQERPRPQQTARAASTPAPVN